MRILLMLLFAALGLAAPGLTRGASYQDLVVMIDAQIEGRTSHGAGVVVNETAQQTVIVTALHNIEKGGARASKIDVEFNSLRGKTFSATTSRPYKNVEMDLALIFVDRVNQNQFPRYLDPGNSRVISASKPRALAGAQVQIIGAMGGGRWVKGVKTDRVVSGTDKVLEIASAGARTGASGGGIFDSLGRLLGVVSKVDSSTGNVEAIPMAAVLTQMQRWGVEAGLSSAEAGTAAEDILQQLRKDLRIDVAYIPTPPSDPDYPLKSTGDFPFRLSAKMPRGLLELDPIIEITYQMSPPDEIRKTLTPPLYAIEMRSAPAKVQAQAWVKIADGRSLGPMQFLFDFESGPVAAAAAAGSRGASLLAYSREGLATERRNARVGEQRRLESKVITDRQTAEVYRRSDERQSLQLVETFDRVSIECSTKTDIWKCSYPIGLFGGISRLLHSMQLGTTKTDMFVEIDVGNAEDFGRSVASETARLLSAGNEVQNIYVQIQLKSGPKLGPKIFCKVKQFKGSYAYCTNHY